MTQAKTTTRKTAAKPAAPAAAPTAAEAKSETVSVGGIEFPKVEFPAFEVPKFEIPKFDVPAVDFSAFGKAEIPTVFREFAEKAVAQAKDSFAKLKEAAEEATDAIEDTYETARAGLVEINEKSLDAAKANSDAAYGFAKSLLAVKTFAEAIELQSTFLRQQFEAISAQAKEIQEVAGKVASESAKPAKDAFAKTVESLKPVK